MLTRDEVLDLIFAEKLVAISRKCPLDKLGKVAEALVRGGVKLLEVTFDQQAKDPVKDYVDCLEAIRARVGDALCLGAGTVLSTDQVVAAYEAGARYIISPSTDEGVVRLTRKLGMVSVPGATTPTEIVNAWNMGGDIIKLFPAYDMGYHYIWNLRGPLPHIPLLASGDVNVNTIPEFIKNGITCVGTGGGIITADALAREDYAAIEANARACLKAVRDATQ